MTPQYIFQTEKIEDGRTGSAHIVSNIEVCKSIARFLSTTLGPYGQDKLFYGNKLLLTNDGATVMEKMDYKHPIARLLVEVSKSQDSEVGDGTTSVVILASEILSQFVPLIRNGYEIELLLGALRKLRNKCIEHLDGLKLKCSDENLLRLVETTLNSKNVRNAKSHFAHLLVNALKDGTNKLHIVKRPGGSLKDSTTIKGIAFEKTFTYAGYEQQPKKIENPKICCLNVELEWKSERENGEVRVESVAEYKKMVEAEWRIIDEKLEDIVKLGANVVLSSLPIGDYATQYFASRGIFSAGRVPDLERISKAFGGSVSNSTKYADVCTCSLFEERQLGGIRCNYFIGENTKESTLILRGPGEETLAEVERAIHDAICAIKTALRCQYLVSGGGSVEMELSKFCRTESFTVNDKSLFIYQAVSKAFEKIPVYLAKNFGHDPFHFIQQLRKAHMDGGVRSGVSMEGVADMGELGILEPFESKVSMLKAAFNLAECILMINSTIISAKKQ